MSKDKIEVDTVLLPYFSEEDEPYLEAEDKSYLFHEGVNASDVKEAYRSAVKDLHPDQGGHEKAFKRANDAREMLEETMEESEATEFILEPETVQTYSEDHNRDESADYKVSRDEVVSNLERNMAEAERETERMRREAAGIDENVAEVIDKVRKGEIDPEDTDIHDVT